MPLQRNGAGIGAVYRGATAIGRVYRGGALVFEAGGGAATMPLDAYSGTLAAAYSIRRLLTSYAGPAMRVRRDSDNAEADIGFVGGVLDTAALLAFVGAGTGSVATWYDQSGHASHATQATAANQPQIAIAGALQSAGGRPAIRATPTSVLVTAPLTPVAQPYEVYVVANETTGSGTRRLLSGTPILFGANADWRWHAGTALIWAGGRDAARHLFVALASGATSLLRIDGVTRASGNAGGSSIARIAIGADVDGSAGLGDGSTMQEVLYFAGDQSANRDAIEAEANTHYVIY